MNVKDVRTVLFDLDGTLIDTVKGLTQLVNLMRKDFGKPPLSEEIVGRYIGKGMLVLVRRAMTESMDAPLDDQIYQLAVKSLFLHTEKGEYHKGTIYPGTKEVIESLKKKGLKIAVVTNKPYNMTLEVLEQAGIKDLFDVIIGGDSASSPKPSGAPVLLACEKLGVEPGQAIMVGDSGNDSQSAKAAGVACLLVSTGWSEGIPLSEIAKRDGAEAIISTLSEVSKFIG